MKFDPGPALSTVLLACLTVAACGGPGPTIVAWEAYRARHGHDAAKNPAEPQPAIPPPADSIRIVEVMPTGAVTAGTPTQFVVTVDYSMQSTPTGQIEIGFNSSDANDFLIVADRVVANPQGREIFAVTATPVDWGIQRTFKAYTLLSAHLSGVATRYLDHDEEVIPVTAAGGGIGLTLLGANSQGYLRYRNEKDGTVLVKLLGGSFTMGSSYEPPAHPVTVSGFYVGETEVTWGQYKAYVAANPGVHDPSIPPWNPPDDHPVVNVSWNDIQDYLTWAGLRLLTEAEWEYAARGGRVGDVYATSDGTISHDLANFDGLRGLDLFIFTSPVTHFPPNPFGIFDMSGNVSEWCADWYDTYPPTAVTDPTGPSAGTYRVRRGGTWNGYPFYARATDRSNQDGPGARENYIGFRLARSLPRTPPITAPSGLMATAASSSQIDLSWANTSSDGEGFKIERKTGAGAFSEVYYAAANATSWSDVDRSASTTYTYRIRSYNGAGNSAFYSNEASATTRAISSGGGTILTALGTNSQGYERYRNDKDGTVLVKLPGGSFNMGSPSGVGNADEYPPHQVTLSPYYVGETEVSWGQWRAYAAANPGAYNPDRYRQIFIDVYPNSDDLPVNSLYWFEIQQYLAWAGLRLPTEAEWEYAARGGLTGDVYATADGTLSHDLANDYLTAGRDIWTDTSPVASFPANPYGLYDMSGNVSEIVADWYGAYSADAVTDPPGPASGTYRVQRGGSWETNSLYLRAAGRFNITPAGWSHHVGFRVARTP